MKRCKFAKTCRFYSVDSHVCNNTGGMYYDNGDSMRPAGCYRNLEEQSKDKKWDLFFLAQGYIGALLMFWLYSSGRLTP